MITEDFPKNIAVMHDDTPKIMPDATAVARLGFMSANVNVTVSVTNAADSGFSFFAPLLNFPVRDSG